MDLTITANRDARFRWHILHRQAWDEYSAKRLKLEAAATGAHGEISCLRMEIDFLRRQLEMKESDCVELTKRCLVRGIEWQS